MSASSIYINDGAYSLELLLIDELILIFDFFFDTDPLRRLVHIGSSALGNFVENYGARGLNVGKLLISERSNRRQAFALNMLVCQTVWCLLFRRQTA